MTRSTVRRKHLSLTGVLALAMSCCLLLIAAAARAEDEGIAKLAGKGEFSALLDRLNGENADRSDPRTAALIQDLTRYRDHENTHRDDRSEAYQKALEEVAKHTQDGKLNKALFSAAEARSLAIDKTKLNAEPQIVALVQATKAAAKTAEDEGKWLDVLNLYRGLDMLFDIDGTYHDEVKRVTNVVRTLRIYAPEKLKEIYDERAKRLDEDDAFEPLQLDKEEWPNRLNVIKWDMMRQAVERAARFHVEGGGFKPMLLGSIDALKTLIATEQLKREFVGLADKEKALAFERQLAIIRGQIDAREDAIGQWDTLRYLNRIRTANTESINLPEGVLVYEMAEGATGTLDDYSTMIWPHDLAELMRTLQGNFQGVGILLSRDAKRLTVKSPLENGPAIKAGIRAGDIIVTVDDQPTEDWSLNKAVENITGPENTKVTLGIERGHKFDEEGEEEKDENGNIQDIKKLSFELTRQQIKIGSVTGWERSDNKGNWNYWIDKEWGVGYVRISQFLPQTVSDMDRAINALKASGKINGLIIDLRFNPGGLLRAAVEVSDRFIPEGEIVSTVDVNGVEQESHSARKGNTYDDFPVVVLVNQGSASASEIVSGALQSYGRATILGMRSFGKGSVQDMFNIQNGKALLKLTTQYYRLPNKRIIHRKPKSKTWGIEPDVHVDMSDQQVAESLRFRSELDVLHLDDEALNKADLPKATEIFEKGLDPQLEAAVLLLKTTEYARHFNADGRKQARRDEDQ